MSQENIIDNKSEHLKLPLPNANNSLIDDVLRIIESLNIIDSNAKNVSISLSNQETSLEELTASSSSGITNAQNTANNAITKADNAQAKADSNIENFIIEDNDGTELSITNGKELKFNGVNITINFTNTSDGSDANPYDLTFTIDNASTSVKGVVQLSDSVSSTSSDLAASLKAVKTAYDRGSSALTVANSKWTAVNATSAIKGIVALYNGVNSTSSAFAATAGSVKTAYDEARKATSKAYVNATNNSNYIKFSNGVIMQWGVFSHTSSGAQTITFPTPFASASTISVQLTLRPSQGTGYIDRDYTAYFQATSITTTNFKHYGSTVSTLSDKISWFAIGK